jgi:maleylacetate reductase
MGASHAIGHVLGGTCDVPHYLCTAVMMPSVLKYNQPVTDEAQRKIAEVWRAPDSRASDVFAQFIGRLGLPGHLSEVGVTKEKFELIGRNAMLSIFTRANPRTIKGPEDIVEILQLAA